jgi:hypothetical protein
MAEQADKEGDRKTNATAMSLAQKAALDILNLITDNHWLIDEAYEVKKEEEEEEEKRARTRFIASQQAGERVFKR